MFDTSGFWRWFDRAARLDFFGTLLGFFFDWKLWLPTGGAAMIAFLSGIAEGKSFVDALVSTSLFAAAAAVIVIAILLLIRTMAGDASPHEHDWKSAANAVEAFAEPALLAARDQWSKKFDKAHESGGIAEDTIRDIRKKFVNGNVPESAPEARLIDNNRRKLEVSTLQVDIAKEELRRAWDALRSDIHKKLCGGKLISKGFRAPHVGGNPEVTISSAEWRALTLDNIKSEAIRDGDSEILYTGLLISNEPGS
jgi:hypothetical protein